VFDDNVRSSSSSRSSSQGSRSVTPIYPKLSPGILVNPSLAGFIPLQSIGKPLILPKPGNEDSCFSPPLVHSPLTSPQLLPRFPMLPTATSVPEPVMLPQFFPDMSNSSRTRPQWLRSVIKVPARLCKRGEERERFEKGSQKKTIPNGYMLYCKERRNSLVKYVPASSSFIHFAINANQTISISSYVERNRS
jgi:hypothetical protein